MKNLLIGLDIGTSSVKAGLFDVRGKLLARSAAPVALFTPEPGWAEQDPGEWWQGVCRVLGEVLQGVDPVEVRALGLSGQCPGHVLIDQSSRPIGRAMIWRDLRAREEAAWLKERIPPKQAEKWVGTGDLGQASCPPARLLWLKKHQPEAWARTVKILQPKDFIALQLTGTMATDRNSAYCLANPETAAYDRGYFDLLGIPVDMMPEVLDPTAILGEVSADAGRQTGMNPGTRVITGTIDAYCDNLSGGVIFEGRAVDVAGTSEIVSLGINKAVVAQGVYPARIGSAGMFLCGPSQTGSDILRWLADCFFPEFEGRLEYESLEREAQSVPAGSDGLVFLPYLNGERAPIWDAGARGVFFGLTFAHDRRQFSRAVYESIGFTIRHILEVSETAVGKSARELVVCGGGSQSRFWNQVKADILQRPVLPTFVSETGCLGAAILASVGAGLYTDLKTACELMIVFKDALRPNQELAALYDRSYRTYRQLYPALKPVFLESVL